MKTFKEFIGEFAGAPPSAGGPMAAPQAGSAPAATPAPAANSGASTALQNQSQNLGRQIQDINVKLQKLIQQKAAIDKQIGQANTSASQNTAASTQATTAAVAGAQ